MLKMSPMLKEAFKNTFWQRAVVGWVLLALLLFVSALLVVYVKHEYRQQFIAVQNLKINQQKLYTQWTQLLLEKGTFANYNRIEEIAHDDMGMVMPVASDIRILTLPGSLSTTEIPL